MRERAEDVDAPGVGLEALMAGGGAEPVRGLEALMAGGGAEPVRGLDALMAAARAKAEDRGRDAAAPAVFAAGSLAPSDEPSVDGPRVAMPSQPGATAPPVRASSPPVGPTLWQRFATGMRRPSALAFASMLLLVGGAVVVTRDTGEEAPVVAAGTSESPAPPMAVGAGDSRIAPAAPVAPASQAPRSAALEAENPAGKADEVSAPAQRLRAKDAKQAPVVVAKPAARPALSEADGLIADRLDVPAGSVSSTAKKAAPASEEETLFRKAEIASKRGDCVEARRLIDQLAARAVDYRAIAARDAAIAKCMTE
jgi:hypothetical protein